MSKNRSDSFGPVLRQLRMEKGLTQDQLSEMVGVASPFISMLESGHKYPNLEMLFKLADALGVRPGAMLDAVEERLRQGLARLPQV
ncbi:helix-turn-helix domain-containing protein [Desulfovibrio sp. OttesenSCG-928-C14]|nr:helix-turn-helix domain-containing protein [Desulfovibrio sp. OttesenSCG-928-C14]